MSTPQKTPMMKQYEEQKERYKDTLLFFRMGDFYEMFHDDAVTAAKALDIALTKRGKAEGSDIPMCGVPVHAYESYLQKLIRAGYKVAICDQLESPEEAKKRGYKEIVRREVVRVVTPGTITEEQLLEAGKSNYLLAFSRIGKEFGLAWVDISTGKFFTCASSADLLAAELARISPSEILLPDNLLYEENFFETYADWKNKLTPQAANIFEFSRAENKFKNFYKVISLEGFGALSRAEISACGALLEYLSLTQKEALPALEFPQQIAANNFVQIDAATRKSLDFNQLFDVINHTKSAAGARLLFAYLSSPLIDPITINNRLDAVEYFTSSPLHALKEKLKQLPDLERAVSRVCVGRSSPRDMLAIRNALATANDIRQVFSGENLPPLLAENVENIKNLPTLLGTLADAFRDDAGFMLKDGNFIREGFNRQLDNLINLRDHSRQLVNNLREKYAVESGVSNLKIIHNNMLGFFVEISAQNAKKLGENFIHRQTMANAMRFTTVELAELQDKIISARDEALAIELRIYAEIAEMVRSFSGDLYSIARALAFIDVVSSFAELTNYTRPKIDNSREFNISRGRHAVVETTTEFVPNNCDLGEKNNIWLLTGPNMAGKSTFLRQNALIAILAQTGCFVPAASAHIGVVDKIFSRVGAFDDLARGRSTFMVEMVETAAILNLATNRSLVILDEIGRGTATYDGLSIAWAALEHLHNEINCRTIFATHYHELTASALPRVALHSMQVREWKEDIIFLHEVASGAADKSYGIHVAKLAGIPRQVTARAEKILRKLESGSYEPLPLFEHAEAPTAPEKPDLLANIDPNNLTPKEALELIFSLKNLPH